MCLNEINGLRVVRSSNLRRSFLYGPAYEIFGVVRGHPYKPILICPFVHPNCILPATSGGEQHYILKGNVSPLLGHFCRSNRRGRRISCREVILTL